MTLAAPKPFQSATIAAALRTLSNLDGPRRFLVADEPGLGKTLVAREIIAGLLRKKRSFVVFYICNSRAISRQNGERLVEGLPMPEEALVEQDRLTLLGTPNRAGVKLFSLTPETSFPGMGGRASAGTKEERAILYLILSQKFPDAFSRNEFRGQAKDSWKTTVDTQEKTFGFSAGMMAEFVRHAVAEFDVANAGALVAAIKQEKFVRRISKLRRALVAAMVARLRPDLIVFDEFQRYRQVVVPDADAYDPLISKLLAPVDGPPPPVLLLSATPYRMFAERWEEEGGADGHRELFRVVRFLGGTAHGEGIEREAKKAFATFAAHLRALPAARFAEGTLERNGTFEAAAKARDRVEALLRPLIARTERRRAIPDIPPPDPQRLTIDDTKVFRHLKLSFRDKRYTADALAFWSSVPLPAQTLGAGYLAWKNRQPKRVPGLAQLSSMAHANLEPPKEWPHPKLRAFHRLAPPESLALPWIAPSARWWPLAGPWKDASEGKSLIFTRFRAAPGAIAGLTSFSVEAEILPANRPSYAKVWKKKALQPGVKRRPLPIFFHPSPVLIQATCGYGPDLTKPAIRRKLKAALAPKVTIDPAVKSGRDVWELVVGIEKTTGDWPLSLKSWRSFGKRGEVIRELVEALNKAPAIQTISRKEFEKLVTHAFCAPGPVLGRALLRHRADALDDGPFQMLLSASWRGLRVYLDNPVFFAGLKGKGSYFERLMKAIVDGNFEAVLDEHFWISGQSPSHAGSALIAGLGSVLQLRTGQSQLHSADRKGVKPLSLRCHAAMAFGQAGDAQASIEPGAPPLRTEDLRKAFNSPFWPHVLITTSVGQEGLDFHHWCRRVVHWDLCSNPVDLEQREGRVDRYASLAVRRALAKEPDASPSSETGALSPWDRIAEAAQRNCSDPGGLSPWWVMKGADIDRVVLEVSGSEQAHRLKQLRQRLLLYRLALGQPNQEDLVETLGRGTAEFRAEVARLSLDLRPVAAPQEGPSATSVEAAD